MAICRRPLKKVPAPPAATLSESEEIELIETVLLHRLDAYFRGVSPTQQAAPYSSLSILYLAHLGLASHLINQRSPGLAAPVIQAVWSEADRRGIRDRFLNVMGTVYDVYMTPLTQVPTVM